MKIRNFRWYIAGLLLLASVLNYLDRNTVAVLAPSIQRDLNISDQEYAHVMSFFMIAYTIAYLCSGWLVDVLGPRISLSLFVGWWSISNSLTGIARGVTSLGVFRFMLGLGEAGGYTASPKVVSEWFPARDRGIAVGLYSVGGALGAVIAPLLVLGIAGYFSDTTFTAGSFKDAPALIAKLEQRVDPVSAFLSDRLAPETRQLLPAASGSPENLKRLQSLLAQDFNAITAGGTIYEEERFSKVTSRRPETVKLLAKISKGGESKGGEVKTEKTKAEELVKLNRLLLEDAYPREISIYVSWRSVFMITPLFGLTFVALWLWLYRKPEEHKWLTEEERTLILTERKQDEGSLENLDWRARLVGILTNPAVWALMMARLLTDPVWYFLNFWLPKYMSTERHLEQSQLSWIWTVYLAADIGFLSAGFISGFFVRRGCESMASRRRVMLGAACLVPLAPLVSLWPGVVGSFVFAAIIALAHTAWLASLSTYIVDLVPKRILATAFGFIAAGSAFGGIMMNEAVGWVVTHYSYRPCYYAMVALHPTAFLLIWLYARKPWAGQSATA